MSMGIELQLAVVQLLLVSPPPPLRRWHGPLSILPIPLKWQGALYVCLTTCALATCCRFFAYLSLTSTTLPHMSWSCLPA